MEPAAAPPRAAPLIVAHRGAWADSPQNSPEALEAAIALGCDMVELDVRRTRDGVHVAVHDARVGGAAVSALDHSELRRRLAPGQAPRLEELLEAAAGRIALDVELKEDGYVEAVLALLAARLEPQRYVVTSFLDPALAAARRAAGSARTGLLLHPGRRPRGLERRMADSGASFLAPHASLARAGLLAWAANRGLRTYVWTVNDVRALRALLADERVEGVITDRPERALAMREDAQAAEPRAAARRRRRRDATQRLDTLDDRG